jgi:hypothetical protein
MAAVLILQLQPGLLNLTMRRTDVFVHEQLRLTPLSVSADRIAHVAFRCGPAGEARRCGRSADRPLRAAPEPPHDVTRWHCGKTACFGPAG